MVLVTVIIFLLGAALGSFVGVIADRYNTGLTFWFGRSFCFTCNAVLKLKDLIPIFSFIKFKGRCKYCGSRIPYSTLIIELCMGILAVLAAIKIGIVHFEPTFGNYAYLLVSNISFVLVLKYLLLVSIFGLILLLSIYDLRHLIIPDSFLIVFLILGFIYNSFFLIQNSLFLGLTQLVASGVLLALPFAALYFFSGGKWMGFGDVKYIAVIGFFLGIIQGLSAVVIAFWLGAIYAVAAIVLKKVNIRLPLTHNNLTIKSEIPFGPFLSAGLIASLCLNADIFQIQALFGL